MGRAGNNTNIEIRRRIPFVAMNIVNAILEEAGTDVAIRQRINDDCDRFVIDVLESLLELL